MAEIAQGAEAVAGPAGPGCAEKGEPACAADPAQADLATGLARLSCLVQRIVARVSDRQDLTPVQARLLSAVADSPRGMADLANCFGVEKAALTGLVDRAERRGLAERTSVPGDRRALHVTPTEAGRQAAAAFRAEVAAELGGLVAGLPPHDREHLRRILGGILNAHGEPCQEHPSLRP